MSKWVFSVFLLISLEINLVSQQSILNTVPGENVVVPCECPGDVIDGYLLYLPRDYDKSDLYYPLLVFFQGGLGVGGEIRDLANWALPEVLSAGDTGNEELDGLRLDSFIVISPHMSAGNTGRQYSQHEEAIRKIMEEVSCTYRVDDQRIYLTGLSRGGHGTWGLASRMTDKVAAIMPICGGLQDIIDMDNLKEMPIWLAHNTGDEVVSIYGATATYGMQGGGAVIHKISKRNGIFPSTCSIECRKPELHMDKTLLY